MNLIALTGLNSRYDSGSKENIWDIERKYFINPEKIVILGVVHHDSNVVDSYKSPHKSYIQFDGNENYIEVLETIDEIIALIAKSAGDCTISSATT